MKKSEDRFWSNLDDLDHHLEMKKKYRFFDLLIIMDLGAGLRTLSTLVCCYF